MDELYRFDGEKLDKINVAASNDYKYEIFIDENGCLVVDTDDPRVTAKNTSDTPSEA